MKTTLNISDAVMDDLRKTAQRTGKTMSELVETALRSLLSAPAPKQDLPDLPTFEGGTPRVDVANREALYSVMESG